MTPRASTSPAVFEYETVWAFGANSLISDLDDIAMMDRLCDDIGLDTIDSGNAIAIAMEAGLLEWGDSKGAIALLKRVYDPKDPLGRIFGGGAAFLAQAYGVDRVSGSEKPDHARLRPQGRQGHRASPTPPTPMGADHTAGYAICQNLLGVGGKVDPLSNEGQAELSKNLQIATAAIDATGLCLFVAFPVLDTPRRRGHHLQHDYRRHRSGLHGQRLTSRWARTCCATKWPSTGPQASLKPTTSCPSSSPSPCPRTTSPGPCPPKDLQAVYDL